jgi:hypothetical protein
MNAFYPEYMRQLIVIVQYDPRMKSRVNPFHETFRLTKGGRGFPEVQPFEAVFKKPVNGFRFAVEKLLCRNNNQFHLSA